MNRFEWLSVHPDAYLWLPAGTDVGGGWHLCCEFPPERNPQGRLSSERWNKNKESRGSSIFFPGWQKSTKGWRWKEPLWWLLKQWHGWEPVLTLTSPTDDGSRRRGVDSGGWRVFPHRWRGRRGSQESLKGKRRCRNPSLHRRGEQCGHILEAQQNKTLC